MRSSSVRSRIGSTSWACSSELAGLTGPMVQPSWARCLPAPAPSQWGTVGLFQVPAARRGAGARASPRPPPGIRDCGTDCGSWEVMCPNTTFHASRDSAQAYLAARGDIDGQILDQDAAVERGRRNFGPLLGGTA